MAAESPKTKEELIEQLAESEAEYRLALDAMLDAVHVVDRDLRILLVNEMLVKWAAGFGITGELVGRTIREVFGFLPDAVWEEYRRAFGTGETVKTEETTFVDNREVVTATTKVPIVEGGKVTKVLTVLHDITDRRKMETALRESEEKFRTLAEESPNIIFIMIREKLVYANQQAFDVLGYTREEFYSPKMNLTTLVAPECLEKTSNAFARYLEGQEVEPFEYALIARDGKRIPAIVASRIVNYEGEKALMGVITDISGRKAAEEALRRNEEKYRTFVENFHGIAYRGGLDGTPIFFEGDVERITGYTEDEFLAGKPKWEEIIHPDDRRRVARKFAPEGVGSEMDLDKEYRIVRRDGRILWVHHSVRPVRDDAGTPILVQGVIYDITDRKLAELSRDRERRAFRLIAKSAVVDGDSAAVCRLVVPELAGSLGFERGTLRLFDPERQVLTLVASVGLTDEEISAKIQDQPIESRDYVATHVARTGEAIYASDVEMVEELEPYKKRIDEMNARALVAWPFFTANKDLLGTLHLFHGERKDIPGDDREFFETIAGMLCVVLDRKRTQAALERSEALYRRRFESSPVPQWEEDLSGVRKHLLAMRAGGVKDFADYFNQHPEEIEACARTSRILAVNNAALTMFGVTTLEDFDRRRIRNLTTVSRGTYVAVLDSLAEGEVGFNMPVEVGTSNGKSRRLLMRVIVAPGYEESLRRVMISMVDTCGAED